MINKALTENTVLRAQIALMAGDQSTGSEGRTFQLFSGLPHCVLLNNSIASRHMQSMCYISLWHHFTSDTTQVPLELCANCSRGATPM